MVMEVELGYLDDEIGKIICDELWDAFGNCFPTVQILIV